LRAFNFLTGNIIQSGFHPRKYNKPREGMKVRVIEEGQVIAGRDRDIYIYAEVVIHGGWKPEASGLPKLPQKGQC
jgi:hypothetical protein